MISKTIGFFGVHNIFRQTQIDPERNQQLQRTQLLCNSALSEIWPHLLLQCGFLCIMLQLLVLSDANFPPEIFGEKHLSISKYCWEKLPGKKIAKWNLASEVFLFGKIWKDSKASCQVPDPHGPKVPRLSCWHGFRLDPVRTELRTEHVKGEALGNPGASPNPLGKRFQQSVFQVDIGIDIGWYRMISV